jgi:hypothetical protein
MSELLGVQMSLTTVSEGYSTVVEVVFLVVIVWFGDVVLY